ncbi:MAG: hypothetical protein ACI8P7_000357 [Candidatus Azotimanducaceae bacterium]|jgi:hypothetical protein
MKNIILSSIIILCSLVFIGCEQVIPVEFDYDPKMAVAFSLENNMDSSTVFLSESRTILADYGIRAVQEADITVKLNGQEIGNAQFDELSGLTQNNRSMDTITIFKFGHSSSPQPGDQLSLEISHPRLETVTSTAIVPKLIQNINVDYLGSDTTTDEWSYEAIWFDYEIGFDDAGGDNFYGLMVGGEFQEYKSANRSILENQSTEVTDGAEAIFYTSDIFFSNQFFKGKRAKLQISVGYQINGNIPFLSLISLSNAELESRLAASKQENTYTDFFSEPITIPTNIENGLGYFGYVQKYSLQ